MRLQVTVKALLHRYDFRPTEDLFIFTVFLILIIIFIIIFIFLIISITFVLKLNNSCDAKRTCKNYKRKQDIFYLPIISCCPISIQIFFCVWIKFTLFFLHIKELTLPISPILQKIFNMILCR